MTTRKTTFNAPTHIDKLIGGNQINITHIIQLPGFIPPPKLEKLRADYIAYLRRAYRVLDFKGIPQFEAITHELLLEEVYVPLLARPELPGGETWERRLAGRVLEEGDLPLESAAWLEKGDNRPLHVEEALRDKPHLVVLGDPGSGKTTLLKYLTLRLAEEEEAPLPILISLNAYARALQRDDLRLQAYLPVFFAGQAQDVADLAPLFDAAIDKG